MAVSYNSIMLPLQLLNLFVLEQHTRGIICVVLLSKLLPLGLLKSYYLIIYYRYKQSELASVLFICTVALLLLLLFVLCLQVSTLKLSF